MARPLGAVPSPLLKMPFRNWLLEAASLPSFLPRVNEGYPWSQVETKYWLVNFSYYGGGTVWFPESFNLNWSDWMKIKARGAPVLGEH